MPRMTASGFRTHLFVSLILVIANREILGSLPRIIKIGGLFGLEEEPITTQNMFKYAVYRINHEPDILKGTELEYDIRSVHKFDLFKASKDICNQVQKGAVAFFGPENPEIASFTNSLCSYLHIPHIEFREDFHLQNIQSGFSINIHPSTEELAEAYLDVIKSYNMKHVLIVYGERQGLLKMQTLMRTITTDLTKNFALRQIDFSNAREILKEAKRRTWRNIIVDLELKDTADFLKMALQEGMIDPYHHYILTTLEIYSEVLRYQGFYTLLPVILITEKLNTTKLAEDARLRQCSEPYIFMDIEGLDLDDYKYNYVNMTGFRIVNPNSGYTKTVTEGMYYYEMETRLELLHKTNYNTIPYRSALLFDAVLLFAKALQNLDDVIVRPNNASCDEDYVWKSGKPLYDFLKQAEVDGLTGKVKIHQGRRMQFNLDVMQLKESGLKKTGTWRFKEGVNFSSTFEHTHTLFENKTLNIGTVLNRVVLVTTKLEAPYVMERDLDKGVDPNTLGNERYEGFCIDLLQEIAAIVGFKYRIIPTKDGQYGKLNKKTKQWNGLVRDLIDRKADIAVAALTISYLREQAIDFTKPFLNLGISILFKTPERKKPGIFSFLNPLAIEIWIYVVTAYVVVSFSIFVLARFSPYEWYNPHPCNPETDTVENTFGLSNSFWFTVGTLMQQGSDVNPRAISTRIVGATWWFFTLIIISSYTANLAAFLTVERMDSPITSADDLAKQTEIEYGCFKGGATETFFRESQIPTYRAMWNFMNSREKSVFVESSAEGVERVKNQGNYAYLMESTSIDYVVEQNCDLMQVGGLLDAKGYGIGTPMSSPLRDPISMAILSLQEQGKIQDLYNKWWKGTSKCMAEKKKVESLANALTVDNIGGIFVVLLGGLAIAILIAFLEFVWKSKRNAREDRQSLCSEMIQELRFAVRCHGSTKKPRNKKKCTKCNKDHTGNSVTCPLTADISGESPANGIIHLRELRKSPVPPGKEFKFGEGGYLHVDYSDTET